MVEAERRSSGYIFCAQVEALGAELVFLALSVALPQFAALAVEYDTGDLMATLAAVELHQIGRR